MWTLAVLLWAAAAGGPTVAAGTIGCPTSIQVNGTADGGHQLLLGAQLNDSCQCQRLDISHQPCAQKNLRCVWKVPGLRAVESPPDQLRAEVTARLAGWYSAKCCVAENDGPCYQGPMAEMWLDGLHYDTWNVSISVQQTAGDVPQLSVEVTGQMDPSTDLKFYLPKLFVSLRNVTSNHKVEDGSIDIPGNRSFVFGEGGGLAPGEYKVEVKPRELHCGGSCTSRYLLHNVTAPEPASVGLVLEAPATGRVVYPVLGVLVALVLVALVAFLSYTFLCGRRGRHWLRDLHRPPCAHKSPLPSAPPPPMTVSVLLLHRGGGGGGGGALDQLRDALRAVGMVVLDARERSVLNLMMTFPSPADLLALEALKNARLLFVGGGGGSQTNPVSAAMYDNMLKFVRNGRLGMDYGRVFAATLADTAGDELAGLVEGRLFLLPACLSSLVEHIVCACRPAVTRQCSVESQADLLPAGGQTDGPAQLSVV